MEAKSPTIANIPLTDAGKQYDVRLLPGCKKFILQTRIDPLTGERPDFNLYFIKDGGYLTVSQFIEQTDLFLTREIICWVSCAVADQVLEVLQWV